MPLTGYLKIPDIPGESQRVDHEDEIDVQDISWGVERATTASIGRGRARARADLNPLVVEKFYDRASPFIAQAVRQGKSFDEVVLAIRKDSGEAHLDYLIITMENVVISSCNFASGADETRPEAIGEVVEFEYERVSFKYVVQEDDHSAGSEYEVTLSA